MPIFVKRDGEREFPELVVSVFESTPTFAAVKEHIAIAAETAGGSLIAIVGPVGGPNEAVSLRYAHLFAASPDGLAAAELALSWIYDPDEPVETFERIAEAFYRDTGFMRPGKDSPAAAFGPSHEVRAAEFETWCAKRSRAVRAALSAFVAKARGA